MPIPLFMNAQAGLHKDTLSPERMRELIRELQLDVEVVATQCEDEMCSQLRELLRSGTPLVAVAGGDGTIHAAVQCLACTEAALAIIPQGTRNNFAHALGLPLKPEHSLALLREPHVTAVDLGKAFGTFFTEAAGVGVFADVLDAYGDVNKSFWRGLAAICKVWFSLRPKRLRLIIDGKLYAEKAIMCTVANGYRMGASAPIAPGASVVDGLLDVVILGPLSRWELGHYYREIKRRGNASLPKIARLTARHVRIEAAMSLAVHIDDHVAGRTPCTVEVVKGGLRVVVPN